ncbi:hypothetical protein CQA01_17390 [Cyclobacterium qasimii]|uniref:Uncharacterized protein n=1 Tax=Cyclobacterium qasimii TaxID=1350429 RepID=A0A512CAP0_9BACT|nr:hypothetical protein CQA01_17390 [Cyclobacterium qasimii]
MQNTGRVDRITRFLSKTYVNNEKEQLAHKEMIKNADLAQWELKYLYF